MKTWRLKSGSDRRFRTGHPWVYSNELTESPKGIEPGEQIELQDAGGKFLARGYGNPSSLIAFRSLSRDPAIESPLAAEAIFNQLARAGELRRMIGLGDFSHRLCFGEADEIPGLVIDRYRLKDKGQVYVIQAHTAGIDRALPAVVEALQKYSAQKWNETSVVIRGDLGVRKLEGLTESSPRVEKEIQGVDLSKSKISVMGPLASLTHPPSNGDEPTYFEVDLISGQKTGFFLDQATNIHLAALRLANLRPDSKSKPLRILDLCCYVGQWGTQLARVFKQSEVDVEVTAVDASAPALELAKKNIEAQGASVISLKADVLRDLGQLKDSSYDIVVSDPPALIKGRKDLPQGTHAYLQLNTQALRLVRAGGGIVTCSCSGLLPEEDFFQAVNKAAGRNSKSVRWVARGTQSGDHPMRTEFPEGRYLKALIGLT